MFAYMYYYTILILGPSSPWNPGLDVLIYYWDDRDGAVPAILISMGKTYKKLLKMAIYSGFSH